MSFYPIAVRLAITPMLAMADVLSNSIQMSSSMLSNQGAVAEKEEIAAHQAAIVSINNHFFTEPFE